MTHGSVSVERAIEIAGSNANRLGRTRLVLLLAALLIGGTAPSADSKLAGVPAPDFVLKGMDGENLRLSEFLGEVVMLNFWATWCGSCRQEMPELEQVYGTY